LTASTIRSRQFVLAFSQQKLYQSMNKSRSIQHDLIFFMKITVYQMLIMMILTTLVSAADLRGQEILERKVSIHVDNKEIRSILAEIERQVSVTFTYRSGVIEASKKISLNAEDKKLREVLKELFNGTIEAVVIKDEILLRRALKTMVGDNVGTNDSPIVSFQIHGKVTDEQGDALPGVNVVEKGTSNGTVTDSDGLYALTVSNENATVVFTFVGFVPKEVSVGNQATIDVSLNSDIQTLSEVIVVGYGTQKKINVTGSVSTVSSSDIEDRPVTSVANALQGKMAGVTVTAGTGQPGKNFGTINIRGIGTGLGGSPAASAPLIIVDGVVVQSLEVINPGDIANISVLKDAASAAIYGARASNGVILVTTKTGEKGHLKILYNVNGGLQSVIRTPDFVPSWQQAQLYNQALENEGIAPRWTDEDIQLFKDGTDATSGHPNTDWLDRFYTEPGYQQNHDLSLSGGDEKTTYRFSLGYLNQQGNVKKLSYEKYNVRFNINSRFNDRLAMNANLAYLYAPFSEPLSSRWGGFTDMLYVLNRISNTVPEKWPNGAYGYVTDGNPLAWLDAPSVNRTQNYTINGNVGLDWSPIQGLHLKPSLGYRSEINQQKAFVAETQFYTGGPIGAPLNPTLYFGPTNLSQSSGKTTYTILQLLAEYQKSIGNHHLGLVAGASQEQSHFEYFSAYRQGFLNTSLTELNAAPVTGQSTSGTANEWALQSVFGRLSYDYNDKYLFEANLRYDGSSRFAKGKKWGAFPSFSLGWVISNEGFFDPLHDVVSTLKLRASWGRLGNQQISNYPTYATVAGGQNYSFGQVLSSGIAPTAGANADIQWESTEISGVGLDASFIEDKLSVSIDYFNKQTNDILMVLPVSATFALTPPYQNAGAMRNKGVELTLGFRENIGNVKLDVNGNVSYVKNEVTDLKGTGPIINGNTFYDVGHPFQSLYGYKALGIYQSADEVAGSAVINSAVGPGDIKYEDVNKDGVINADDRMYLGTYFPKVTYGLTAAAHWKGFDVSLFLQGAGGVKANGANLIGQVGPDVQKPTSVFLDAWTHENHSTSFPRLWYTYPQNDPNSTPSSFWVKNASYLRLKSVVIAYNFPSKLFGKKSAVSGVKIYYSGQNLLTFSKFYKWIDPEVGASASFGAYPQVMVNSLGLNVTF
jgi:TonB-linked SusC/RagA family outer membrane protein